MNQLSSLQKGLIFAPQLDEWNQGRDAISGILPANTAVYPVLDSKGSGRRWLEYNGTSSYISLPTIPAFGTGDFTVIVKFYIGTVTSNYTIIGGTNSASFSMWVNSNYKLHTLSADVADVNTSTGTITPNSWNTATYSRSAGVGTYYINSNAPETKTDATNYSGVSNALGKYFGGYYYLSGSISMCRIFNYALTPTQIANYSRPEYPIEWVDRIVGTAGAELIVNGDFQASTRDTDWPVGNRDGWTITDVGGGDYEAVATALSLDYIFQNCSKTLRIGEIYKFKFEITSISSGAFRPYLGNYVAYPTKSTTGTYNQDLTITNVTYNRVGVIVHGSGSTTGRIDNISLVQLGCVLDLNAEGMSSATWVDKTNSLTATNSGTTYVCPAASNLKAMYMNGAAKLAYTGMDAATTDITFATEITPLTLAGRIFDNSKLLVYVNASGYLTVSRDGTTLINSAAASIAINTNYKVAITSTSAGVTNIYINGVLSGTANQAAGTPASGTTWNLGNNAASNQAFTGRMSKPIVENRIMTLDEISLLNSIN